MTSLLLSTRSLPAANALAEAARQTGWQVYFWDENPKPPDDDIAYYGGSDVALAVAERFDLALRAAGWTPAARCSRFVSACWRGRTWLSRRPWWSMSAWWRNAAGRLWNSTRFGVPVSSGPIPARCCP